MMSAWTISFRVASAVPEAVAPPPPAPTVSDGGSAPTPDARMIRSPSSASGPFTGSRATTSCPACRRASATWQPETSETSRSSDSPPRRTTTFIPSPPPL